MEQINWQSCMKHAYMGNHAWGIHFWCDLEDLKSRSFTLAKVTEIKSSNFEIIIATTVGLLQIIIDPSLLIIPKNGHFSSDMMLLFAQATTYYLQEIQYAWVLKNIYTHTAFTWVNKNFHIPLMCLGDTVTMVTKDVSTETTHIWVWAQILKSIFMFLW